MRPAVSAFRLFVPRQIELQIETRSLSSGFPKQELESDEFDLAIAAYFEDVPNGFKMKTVFSDRFVCVCSNKNA
jgi:DNA-binding transcriptional LysR family regulator